tara:strand:+ start:13 stop:567 length:555 start_codon:yes stop_codon:yes gene_type:complete
MPATMEHKLVNGRWRWQPTSSGGGGGTSGLYESYAKISNQLANDAYEGGTTADTTHQRGLNTEDFDPDGIVSISNNEFTLAAGTYYLKYSMPFYKCGYAFGHIYNVTDSAVVANSYTSSSLASTSLAGQQGHIEGSCRLTITGSKAFKVNMYASHARASSGLGYRANESGVPSVYTQVEIWKEA